MKKVFTFIVLFLLSASMVLPTFAAFENPPIVDEAGYLMQSELAELSKALDKIREKYDFDVAIYTESEMSGDTAEESADDIYDALGYGAGEKDDGLLLYICADTRETHLTTHGKGTYAFNKNGLAYLEGKFLSHLKEDDYYEAFEAYIIYTEELLEMAEQGKPFNKKQYSTKYLIGVIAACLFLPLLIAFLLMHNKLKKMKTAVENNYAANYMKPGSMHIAVSRDYFLYSSVTKTERPKSNNGTHTSSSGRTHGGRSGSF